jgi:hypothetical protein
LVFVKKGEINIREINFKKETTYKVIACESVEIWAFLKVDKA